MLERVLRNLEHDVAEHLDEPAIAVEREAAVLRPALQPFDRSSFKPRLRIVSIMPGIENFAPERTETSSGLSVDQRRAGGLLELLQRARRSRGRSPAGIFAFSL